MKQQQQQTTIGREAGGKLTDSASTGCSRDTARKPLISEMPRLERLLQLVAASGQHGASWSAVKQGWSWFTYAFVYRGTTYSIDAVMSRDAVR